ncbi:MAG: hypothetical protein Q9187_000386 [Circinaria calcarea]
MGGMKNYNPDKDVPDLSGKAAAPALKLTFVECDLTSLASVAAAVQQFASRRLDILMCNAGIMAVPPGLTEDGYEVQFGTNHLGHALLIKHLLPTLLQTAEEPHSDVRIILLTSLGFRGHPKGGIVFKDLRTTQDTGAFGSWIRYGQSKLANILYANELARRYPNITSLSIHPGVVETDLVGSLGFANKAFVYVANMGKLLKPAEGAYNQIWAATCDKEKDKLVNGAFYEPIGLLSTKLDKTSKSEKLAEELWVWTEKALKDY